MCSWPTSYRGVPAVLEGHPPVPLILCGTVSAPSAPCKMVVSWRMLTTLHIVLQRNLLIPDERAWAICEMFAVVAEFGPLRGKPQHDERGRRMSANAAIGGGQSSGFQVTGTPCLGSAPTFWSMFWC